MLPSPSIVLEWETRSEQDARRGLTCLVALREQLEELCSSLADPPELVVVFDGGAKARTDVEAALAAAGGPVVGWPARLVKAETPRPLDYYQKKNFGAGHASNPHIVFVDSDVRPEPGWLRALIETFSNPAVSVVQGRTHCETGTLYEQATALYWIFDAGPAAGGARPEAQFWANNFGIRRSLFARLPFPDRPTYRGQCGLWRARLRELGIPVHEAPAARTRHPAPKGVAAFLRRAWRAGADMRFYDSEAAARGSPRGGPRWRSALCRVDERIAARREAVGAGKATVAAARLLGYLYYSVRSAAWIAASGSPGEAGVTRK